jgi:hypothetical protein
MPSTSHLETKVTNFVEAEVERHWEENQSAYYLSALGEKLKRDVPGSHELFVDGLADFLRQQPVVNVVRHPNIPQKIGAIPLSVVIPQNISPLFREGREQNARQPKKVYVPEFWEAFKRPVANPPRLVSVEETGGITVENGAAARRTSRSYEILESDRPKISAQAPVGEKIAATYDAITTWLKKHELNESDFTLSGPEGVGGQRSNFMQRLSEAFEDVPEADLARISIPLDIILKLNSK